MYQKVLCLIMSSSFAFGCHPGQIVCNSNGKAIKTCDKSGKSWKILPCGSPKLRCVESVCQFPLNTSDIAKYIPVQEENWQLYLNCKSELDSKIYYNDTEIPCPGKSKCFGNRCLWPSSSDDIPHKEL